MITKEDTQKSKGKDYQNKTPTMKILHMQSKSKKES